MMSVGFLLNSPDDAVIWRGPKKNGQLIKIKLMRVNKFRNLGHGLLNNFT